MARSVLKTQLKHHQLVSAIDKSKSKPVVTKNDEEDVEQEEIIEKPAKKTTKDYKKSKKEKAADPDAYQSTSLSKKEQRKLKKAGKKDVVEEDEEEEEVEQEQEQIAEDEDDEEEEIDFKKLAESDSESDIDEDEEDEDDDDEEENEEEDNVEDEESDEDVPLSDVELDDDADVVPFTKLTVNNTAALRESLARIELPWSKHMFTEHQSIISDESTEASIKDIYDDTERELAFYKQGLDAVKQARATLLKLKVPFARPMDYFAEMVKSDEHMDKLKSKLLSEAANKKASEEAKKQRGLKKFGKQVQHATLQERAKQKKDTMEKINSLKKKRGSSALSNEDDFQIALEEATKENERVDNSNKRRKPNAKRLGKDSKYGFGGKKRLSRENDKDSSADVSGFNSKKMKGKQARPGKSKRSRRN